jgi:hypothetical protein
MDDLTQQGLQPDEPAIDSEAIGTGKADDTSANAHRQRRMFFITFGSIVFVGLALTTLYLGGRVMETRASGATASKPLPVSTPTDVAAVKPAEPPVKPAVQNEAKPQETTKNQLVAEAKPAPAPSQPAPAPESKPVPAPVSKPQLVAVAKPAPEVPKPPPVLESKPAAKPKSEPVKAAPVKAEPVKPAPPAAVAAQPSAPKHSEEHAILHRDPKPYDGPILKPQPGQIYVQVGAYSPNYTGSFLSILEKKGIHGVVAPGPSQDVNRVLVGPLPDPSTVKNTHGELQKAGLNDAFARKY